MAFELKTTSGRRTTRWLDVVVGGWVALWILMGVLVAWNLYQLRELTDTMRSASAALAEVSDALDTLGRLPLVGDEIQPIADEVGATAEDARLGAAASRSSITQLSWLLGVVVVVIPTAPLLGLFVPFRMARRREVVEVREALKRADRRRIEEYLAWRAVARIPYHELQAIAEDPWNDLREGRFTDLADAELHRLGMRRRA